MSENEEIGKDWETYKELISLWRGENPIKTTKLQVLLAVNAALLTIVNIHGGFTGNNLPIYIAGALVSLVWTVSIGRTALFQKVWQKKIRELAKKYPNDNRFQILETDSTERIIRPWWLRFVGGVSSKYYLLAAPLVFCLAWLAVSIYFVLAR